MGWLATPWSLAIHPACAVEGAVEADAPPPLPVSSAACVVGGPGVGGNRKRERSAPSRQPLPPVARQASLRLIE